MSQNTLYIAEPIFSEKLQKYDADISFPPIKKIGITTDHPERRERELLGTISPVKVSIVKAWTGIGARAVESMLHTMLDNSRLDGEYFWDGNETLVDAVTQFIEVYHPEAKEIVVQDDVDVKAASDAVNRQSSQRIYAEVVPELEAIGIKCNVTKNERAVRFNVGDYSMVIGGRTGSRYTLTIRSNNKTPEEALNDFIGAQEVSANAKEGSTRKARISMATLGEIIESLMNYLAKTSS